MLHAVHPARSIALALVAVLVALLAVVRPVALAADPSPSSETGTVPLRIAVSTPVLADLVARTAGPAAEVWSVVPMQGDPHSHEATPRDLERIGSADLYVEMGANLERYAEASAWRRAVNAAGVPVLRLSDHLELILTGLVVDHGDHVHDYRTGDPHVWLDPAYVRRIVALVAGELTGLRPAEASVFEAASAAYDAELTALEAELVDAFSVLPAERRKLVVLHDAYAYLAARFGFEVIGWVSQNPSQEPSAADIEDLLRVVTEAEVPAVFSEPQLEDDILRMVAAEAGVEVGLLLADSFWGDVDSYVELMRHNRDELVRILG